MKTEAKGHSSQMRQICRRFYRNKLGMLGLILFLIILAATLSVGLFLNYEESALALDVPHRLMGPSAEHWLGTDEQGRDVLARILFGARYTLVVGFASTLFAVLIGGLVGAAAGYFGGLLDDILMRIMEVMMCLPAMLLAIAIVVALGSSLTNLILAIGISNIPKFARIVRSSVMSVRNTEYVQAAQLLGVPLPLLMLRHILLNCLGPVIVQGTLIFAMSILAISSLSFLSLGIPTPTPEWGNMLSSGRDYMRGNPHLVLAPGLAIFLSIFALNLLGDGLRDALDPKMDL